MEPERTPSEAPARIFRDDARFALGRIAVFQYLTVAIFLFLLSGFWVLQVRDHEANSELAERNRIKTVPLLAPRGKILDRDGRVIVDNHSAYTLMLTRENLRPEHVAYIADGLHLDPDDIRARLKRYDSRPKYVPIVLKQELTQADLAFVESHRDSETFPEMELIQNQQRLYPHEGLAAHVIGYVGEVSEQELNTAEFAKNSQGDMVGKFGLERQYNDVLTGLDGQRRVVVDSIGRERQVLESKEATPGNNLRLTLDLDVQAVAELAMQGRRGAVVALDPRNGEVLAMVSQPSFDPNAFTTRIRAQNWKDLTSDPNNPLMNRAIQAQFAPGSTFKPIVALAALETGTIDESFSVHCAGGATFYGRYLQMLRRSTDCGNLHNAIVHSCDVYFYTVGNKLGIDSLAEYGQLAGLGKKTGIDLPGEAEGLMPSAKWKLRTQREKWYAGETISVAIGQGAVTVTPLQLASAIGGLAMGGVWYRPHLVKEPRRWSRAARIWNPDNVAKVISGMYGVVNEGGTGASAQIPNLEVCGKTGSAQRISLDLAKSGKAAGDEAKDNGWFVGFAPCENPEIVVVALYRSERTRLRAAAPIVRDVIKAYFDKKARDGASRSAGRAVRTAGIGRTRWTGIAIH
jgi:penicillin-binding protein 2